MTTNVSKKITGSSNPLASEIRARRVQAADLIDVAKYLPKADAFAALKADAEKAHAQYPQYNGFWDGYRLGRVKKTIKTKMGVAFEPGDLAMIGAFKADPIDPSLNNCVAVYSNRNSCDTVIRKSDVEIL
jgi:hypothetical protein